MAIDFKIPVAIFSLKLSAEQLIDRMISIETGISDSKFKNGDLNNKGFELLKKNTILLSKSPIYIDDSASLSLSELKKKTLHLVIHHNLKFIVVDYLQLLTITTNKNRDEELSMITRELKVLARELNISIFVLSQVSREVDKRENKRPKPSDLFGSSDIETNVDIVSFIYRPEYYGLLKWDDDKQERADGEAEFIIAKNLRGPIDNIRLRFFSRIGLFKTKTENDRDWTPIKKE